MARDGRAADMPPEDAFDDEINTDASLRGGAVDYDDEDTEDPAAPDDEDGVALGLTPVPQNRSEAPVVGQLNADALEADVTLDDGADEVATDPVAPAREQTSGGSNTVLMAGLFLAVLAIVGGLFLAM